MALTRLGALLINTIDPLIPHMEEAAISVVNRDLAMPSRVARRNDMGGWNVRKVSERLQKRGARTLSEDTAIPNTSIERSRLNEIEPIEVGDMVRLSDRRIFTDTEDEISEAVRRLGYSVGERIDIELFEATGNFHPSNVYTLGTTYDFGATLEIQHEFAGRGFTPAVYGTLYQVLHPFQAKTVMDDLIRFNVSGNGSAALDYRNQAISAMRVPAWGDIEIVISNNVPRRVTYVLTLHASVDGGTFRLAFGNGDEIGEHVTAAIAYNATPATLASNIQTALNALTTTDWGFAGAGWVVTSASATEYTITPPANLYAGDRDQLRIAIDYYNNPVLLDEGFKSTYDLLTVGGVVPATDSVGVDPNGDPYGFKLEEIVGATARSPIFYRNALMLDEREPLKLFAELVNQGRSIELSAYQVFGAKEWQRKLGWVVTSTAQSLSAVAAP